MKIVFASEEVGEPEEQQALTTGYQISVSRVQRRRNWTDFGLCDCGLLSVSDWHSLRCRIVLDL